MDNSYDVTDSSDWLNTPVAPLRSVEAALRCQVCKDFYNTPMITTCSHTFCSLCIRRCLTSDGKCPSCRSSDQEIRLRRNWAVQEIVDTFKAARPSILKLGQDLLEAQSSGSLNAQKRKLDNTDFDESDQGNTVRRKTRSQSRRSPQKKQRQRANQIEEHELVRGFPDVALQTGDELAACPICDERMRVEDVFLHLDTHQEDETRSRSSKLEPSLDSETKVPSRSIPPVKNMERLPSLSYSIMNENTLRKKISSIGIPNWGPKQLLIRRHTEWVNIWNANCDSSNPRSKRELLRDLDTWERTQGGNAPNAQGPSSSGNTIMAKDFDSSAWSTAHEDDFRQLIAQARRKPHSYGTTSGADSNVTEAHNEFDGPLESTTKSKDIVVRRVRDTNEFVLPSNSVVVDLEDETIPEASSSSLDSHPIGAL